MAGKIFVNYRRDDSIGTAGRLHDRLADAFGRKNLFMDVDHIPAGVDFVSYLNSQVAECDVFLAVIGLRWLDAKDENGNRRLDNPEDFVSVEIGAALARDIRVIPVLVDGAHMPKAADLPDILKPLVRRNAVELRNAQFGRDAEALAKKVREAFKVETTEKRRWRVAAAGAIALLLAGWIGLYQMGVPVWVPWGAPPESTRRAEVDAALKAEADTRRKAQEEATRKAQEEAARKAQEEAARRADEARRDPALTVAPGSGQSFQDLQANGQSCPMCPEMVVVPSGSFVMGSPKTERERDQDEGPFDQVIFVKPLAVGKFAVTRAEFAAFVAETGHKADDCEVTQSGEWKPAAGRSWRSPDFEQDDRHPVVCMNWGDAQAYVAWVSRKTGKSYRLMSEAEREYVARGGTKTPFWWGASITASQANYAAITVYAGGGALGEYRARTVSVDLFKPNPWGLYNILGNLKEWTRSCWTGDQIKNPTKENSSNDENCEIRATRGGGWGAPPGRIRSAYRTSSKVEKRRNDTGLRIARALEP